MVGFHAFIFQRKQETIDDVATLQRDKLEVLKTGANDGMHDNMLTGMYTMENSPFVTKKGHTTLLSAKHLSRRHMQLDTTPLQMIILGDNTLITVTK